MKRAKFSVILVLLLGGVAVALIQIGLWQANGGILEFVQGQQIPESLPFDRNVSQSSGSAEEYQVTLRVPNAPPIAVVSEAYLSFALDASQVVGGKWWNPRADRVEVGSGTHHAPVFDFNRPKLDRLASALAPAYLRIGGSESDKIYYDMTDKRRYCDRIPEGYHSTLTAGQWDDVNAFARRNGLQLVFTLNAGPSARNPDGSWNPENAEKLIRYTSRRGYPVSLFELGNELNIFWFIYGPSRQVPVDQYHRDLAAARELIRGYFPDTRFSGQGGAFWPLIGEPLGFFYAFTPHYLEQSGAMLDLVSWHFYPQQSRRGPIATRRAHPARLLDPDNLDEVAYWADRIIQWRNRHAPDREIWMGETGNAQFGGEPGVSDVYIGGLWWLDQLGLLARKQHKVVVRQTLVGMDYGMIEAGTLTPRPDYWNSLLWKHYMGRKVLAVEKRGSDARYLRVYAHSAASGRSEAVSLLAINIDPRRKARFTVDGGGDRNIKISMMNTPDILGKELYHNGKRLALQPDGFLPEIDSRTVAGDTGGIVLNPLSYVFLQADRRP